MAEQQTDPGLLRSPSGPQEGDADHAVHGVQALSRRPASIFITTLFLTFTRRFHAGNLITHMYDTGESTTGWWKRSATSAFTRGDTAYCTPCGPQS